MNTKPISRSKIFLSLLLSCCFYFFTLGALQAQPKNSLKPAQSTAAFAKNAKLILKHYERKAYQLKPSKAGHMGLRLYRQYQSRKYEFLLLQGILSANKALDKVLANGLNAEAIDRYVEKSNKRFGTKTEKKRLRQQTLERYPRYRFMAAKLLRHVARLHELGIVHERHEDFMALLKRYDFKQVFTDKMMIKAWGAQLANQVYWLKQLGIADHTAAFRKAVADTYPQHLDEALNKQQFENKIYTLTHIIIAASGYYKNKLAYQDYADIISYFRSQTATILRRAKEDVVIEVGISLLLVDETYPEIQQIRSHINSKVDPKKRMILSEKGKATFAQGEHRNIIAVLLLDWQGCSNRPNRSDMERLDRYLPQTLQLEEATVVAK